MRQRVAVPLGSGRTDGIRIAIGDSRTHRVAQSVAVRLSVAQSVAVRQPDAQSVADAESNPDRNASANAHSDGHAKPNTESDAAGGSNANRISEPEPQPVADSIGLAITITEREPIRGAVAVGER